MIDVLKAEVKVNDTRIGIVDVMYYDLVVYCDICLYKNENLWIRMPEVWLTPERKKRFNSWPQKCKSDHFQNVVLKKVFDMIGLTLEIAIEKRKEFINKKRKQKNSS
jgi:hypothetical protein